MKYAIIAAGEGSRLAQEGVTDPKPLVRLCGERLLSRLLRVFMANGASEVLVICNDRTDAVECYLEQVRQEGLQGQSVPLHYRVKSTPSSMHSFYELSPWLDGDEPFVLTTVDTVFRAADFARYVSAFRSSLASGYDGLMGVTDYIDDEKPLYVGVSGSRITDFYDEPHGCRYISGGIYGLTPAALHTLRDCMARGESRMRNFQRALIADGRRLGAWAFTKVLDIDHAADIAKAEAFLQGDAAGADSETQ